MNKSDIQIGQTLTHNNFGTVKVISIHARGVQVQQNRINPWTGMQRESSYYMVSAKDLSK